MKKNWIIWSLLGCMLLAFSACKDDDDIDEVEAAKALLAKQDQEIKDYLQRNSIAEVKDDRGIYREPLQVNPEGEDIEEGDVVLLHYTIKRLDGTLLATSETADPVLVTFDPNRTYVPISLYRGLSYLNVGDRYRYYVPSQYAYGKYSDGDKFVENSIIIMELEAVDVYHSLEEVAEAEQTNIDAFVAAENLETTILEGGIRKVVLEPGTGASIATGDTAQVYYEGYYLSKEVFDDNIGDAKTFDFKVGGSGVISGFNTAVKSMKVGEKALFIIPFQQAYGKSGAFVLPHAKFSDFRSAGLINVNVRGIAPFSTLVFELELVSKK